MKFSDKVFLIGEIGIFMGLPIPYLFHNPFLSYPFTIGFFIIAVSYKKIAKKLGRD
jgi:hypothetical protein